MWECNNCNREFIHINQSHSCTFYPLENHFKGKEKIAKPLFDEYIKRIKKEIGPVKIESLPCCIHLVSDYTFGAVWALKDRIRIDFRLDHTIKSSNIHKEFKMSANRYLYHLDIFDKKDINSDLIGWLKESYSLHNVE